MTLEDQLAGFNAALQQAIPVANAIQDAIPKGATTGTVLLAFSMLIGSGIKLNPDPNAQDRAVQGVIDVIAGILEGAVTVDMMTEQ